MYTDIVIVYGFIYSGIEILGLILRYTVHAQLTFSQLSKCMVVLSPNDITH